MNKYILSLEAEYDLIRIHQYGVAKYGVTVADKYFESLFNQFEIITQRLYSFESIDHIKEGYRRCVCGADTIYFKIGDEKIEIMAIIGRQDFQ